MNTNKLYNWVFSIFCFFLPFDGKIRIVSNLLLIGLAILFFLVTKKEMLRRLNNKLYITATVFVVYICLLCLLGQDNINNNLFIVRKLVLLPILFVLALPLTNKQLIKKCYIAGVGLTIIISLFRIAYYKFFIEPTLDIAFGNTINELLITERVYLGFMCVISFIWTLEYLRKAKTLLILNLGLILFFLLYVGARIAIITVVLVILIKLIQKHKAKKVIIYAFLSLVVLMISFVVSPSLQKRFLHTHQKGTLFERIKKWEHRVTIWECGINSIKNEESRNQFFGYQSFHLTKENLVRCYEDIKNDKEKRDYFVAERFNSHNQFLDILISAGFLGLLLFLFVFYYWHKSNNEVVTIILAFLLLGAVENFLHRQLGVYLLALTIIMSNNIKSITDSNEKS